MIIVLIGVGVVIAMIVVAELLENRGGHLDDTTQERAQLTLRLVALRKAIQNKRMYQITDEDRMEVGRDEQEVVGMISISKQMNPRAFMHNYHDRFKKLEEKYAYDLLRVRNLSMC